MAGGGRRKDDDPASHCGDLKRSSASSGIRCEEQTAAALDTVVKVLADAAGLLRRE
jgi:hypothetical protein